MLSAKYFQIFFLTIITCIILLSILDFHNVAGYLKDQFHNFNAGFWVWFLLFIAIIKIRGAIPVGNIVVANISQIIIVGCSSIIVVIGLIRNYNNLPKPNGPLICLLLYSTFGVISGCYSPKPFFSTYKALLLFIVFLETILVLSYKPHKSFVMKFIELNYIFYFILLLSFVLGAVLFPNDAFIVKKGMLFGMLKGVIIKSNPNTIGVVAGVLSLVSINRFFVSSKLEHKLLKIILVVLFLSVLIVAQSRTCLAAFLCSLIMLLLLRKKFFILFFLLLFGLGMFSFHSLLNVRKEVVEYVKRGQSEETFKSWSGRKLAWKYSLKKFKESPILGYGMAAGVRFGAVSKKLVGSHLHSSYFEVLLDNGLLGFIPWLVGLLIVFQKIFLGSLFVLNKLLDDEIKILHIEVLAVLIFFIVRSIAGTTFVSFDYTFMIYVSLLVYCYFLSKEKQLFYKERYEI